MEPTQNDVSPSAMFCPAGQRGGAFSPFNLISSSDAIDIHFCFLVLIINTLCLGQGLMQNCNQMHACYLFQQDKHYDLSYDTGDKALQCGRHVDIFKLWLMWRAKVIFYHLLTKLIHRKLCGVWEIKYKWSLTSNCPNCINLNKCFISCRYHRVQFVFDRVPLGSRLRLTSV